MCVDIANTHREPIHHSGRMGLDRGDSSGDK